MYSQRIVPRSPVDLEPALGIGTGLGFGTVLQRSVADQGVEVLAIPWTQLALYVLAAVVVGTYCGGLNSWASSVARAAVASGIDVTTRLACTVWAMRAFDRIPRIGLSNDVSAAP